MNGGGGRVVFVLPSLAVGGSEWQVAHLAGHLVRRGIACEVVCLRSAGALARDLEAAGVRVSVLGVGGAVPWRAMARLTVGWMRERPAIVYSWLSGFDLLAVLPARLARVARVAGSRRELSGWMAPRHRLVQALGTVLADRIVCVSQAVLRDALACEPALAERYCVAANGVELERFAPNAERRARERARLGLGAGELALVTVASLVPGKGHGVLIRALAGLGPVREQARLLWVGEGPLRHSLEEQVRDAGLASNVRFMGLVPDVSAILAAADGFVLPSLSEGLPNAVLEAMAAGLPIIASEVGGMAEVVESQNSGLLVAAGDSASLAAAIERVLREPALRARLGAAARARAEREFGMSAALERHWALLSGCPAGVS